MTQKTPKTRFWTVLAIINIAAMVYPFSLYVQADSNDKQFFATMVALGVGLLLAITDTVSAIVAYLGGSAWLPGQLTGGKYVRSPIAWTIKSREANREHRISKSGGLQD